MGTQTPAWAQTPLHQSVTLLRGCPRWVVTARHEMWRRGGLAATMAPQEDRRDKCSGSLEIRCPNSSEGMSPGALRPALELVRHHAAGQVEEHEDQHLLLRQ